MTELLGDFHSGRDSARQKARLRIDDNGQCRLYLEDGERRRDCGAFEGLTVAPRLGSTPRIIELPDGSGFETRDNDAVDALLRRHGRARVHRWLHRLESHLPLVILATVLVAAFVAAMATWGIPAAARVTAQALSPEINRKLGQGTLEILDRSTFSESELPPKRQQQLRELFAPYVAAYPDWQIRILFRNGGDVGANAMALPGGQILFTDQMVGLAEDDRELLAVLGHEIGHLEHRHLMRRALQNSMITVIIMFISGDVSQASNLIYALPTLLMELAYSRDFELEADDFAYEFLTRNGFSPVWFARIMRRLEDQAHGGGNDGAASGSDFLSTHPPTLERIRRFEESAEAES